MKNGKLTRILALIMAAVMMMCVFTACSKKPEETPEEDEETEQRDEFRLIYEALDPKTPVVKIGDVDMNWDVTYYAFYQEATKLYSENNNQIYDWLAEYQNGETYIVYCMEEAVYNYLRFLAGVEHFAKEYNVTDLTADSQAMYEADLQEQYDLYGGKDELYAAYEGSYLTPDVNEYNTKAEYLFNDLQNLVVGAKGEKLTEAQILELANTAYKCVKVIPFKISDENGNPVSREDKAAALASAQAVLDELKAVPAGERQAKFDELIDQYADAASAEALKSGYTYTRGGFDNAVEKAIKDIGEGELYDGVIEGADNYYVVMRLPVDTEAHPYRGEGQFDPASLRELYADDIFSNIFWDWADNAEVEYYDALNNLDIEWIIAQK
jgi:hypothetical protein